MNIDMGDLTIEAKEIVKKSYSIVERYVKGNTPEDYILKRCIIATGDPAIKDLIRFKNDPIRAGIEAIKEGRRIVTDVAMVKAGINRRAIKSEVIAAIDYGNAEEITRTSKGFYNLKDKLDDSIIAIGNAPTAALTVYKLVKEGVKPSLIVATPVGFVNAAESKEMIRSLNVPSITTEGTRGGSTICVAIVNGIINLALEETRMRK
jgi:precorrin isomerase